MASSLVAGQGGPESRKSANPWAPEGDPQIMRRLLREMGGPRRGSWSMLKGCKQKPQLPANLVPCGDKLLLATGDRIEIYDPAADAWAPRALPLPEATGVGAVFASGEGRRVFLARGGRSRTLWCVDPFARKIEELPPAPGPVGRGSGLVFFKEHLYLARGMLQREFHELDLETRAWNRLEDLGGSVKMPRPGALSGGLLRSGTGIFAWGDHHLQRFDLESGKWHDRTWTALGFRPDVCGGMFAGHAPSGATIFVQGGYSRTLLASFLSVGQHAYLRPRLPYPIIGEGNRAAVMDVGGEPHLFVYALEPDNELCRIPLRSFQPVTRDSPEVETGAGWKKLCAIDGGTGVRRRFRAFTGFTPPAVRGTWGVVGVMGALENELYFVRLRNVRRIGSQHGVSTAYPGHRLDRHVFAGACAAYDGKQSLYVMPGESRELLRWKTPIGPILTDRKKLLKTHDPDGLKVLAPAPAEVGRGAAMVFSGRSLFVLPRMGRRDVWSFDIERSRWTALPPLPDDVPAPGLAGTGLAAPAGRLLAFAGRQVMRLDMQAGRWSRLAELPFAVSRDGGMTTLDEVAGRVYLVAGGVSTRLGRLDPGSGRFEELFPRLPDVVSAEGNRLAVLTVGKGRRLYVHRGHDSNEIWHIDLDLLVPRK
jgi:hypothetical protein